MRRLKDGAGRGKIGGGGMIITMILTKAIFCAEIAFASGVGLYSVVGFLCEVSIPQQIC